MNDFRSYGMIENESRGNVIKSQQFRAARALLGWSQTKLGERAGLSLPTVRRVETGRGAKVSDEARQQMRSALEAAGIEFTNGNAPGVRLRPKKK
jgi:transcriptional regulator with XRE-family HTH domain